MKAKKNAFNRALMLCIGLAIMAGSLIWVQASTGPASAQEPSPDSSLVVTVSTEEGTLNPLDIESPPVFDVGDIFTISIVAQGVPEPGIFGSQFEVVYDTTHLEAVEGTLVAGVSLEPVVNPVATIDPVNGRASWAASRQGDLPDVPGDVVLASLTMKAVGATEPPEGQTTRIDLQNVKLGRKGGIEVDVVGLVPLDVIIREDGLPGDGDAVGNAKVEGRADDNQAGHDVEAVGAANGPFNVSTEANGDFFFDDIPADTYAFTADRAGFLAATCTGVVHAADALTQLLDVVLLAGDISGDGVIDITDSTAIGAAFGSTDPDEIADLNDDGVVDVLDLILHAANFGATSAANPWVCQP